MSARLKALSIALVLIAVFGVWLHLSVVPYIAWESHRGDVSLGWAAIRAAWPVYFTAGGLLGLLGLGVGLFVGDTARERDAAARAAVAERERDAAALAAESAEANAQAAVSTERANLKRQQQQAQLEIAGAKSARTAAENEAARSQQRVQKLEQELGRAQARLRGALRAMQRGEAENAALREEIETLRGEILP